MSRVRENFNLIFADMREFGKNFLSIFGEEKIDEEELENIDSPEVLELQENLKDIESGKAFQTENTEKIDNVISEFSNIRVKSPSRRKQKIEKNKNELQIEDDEISL